MSVPDLRAELKIGGVWTDVTADVRKASKVRHSRGRRSQGARADPASVGLVLNSPNGLYSNRNPLSPYFGLLGRNTPLRLSTAGGDTILRGYGGTNDRAATPDIAALDITGDLDVRVDAQIEDWAVPAGMDLMGKWGANTQLSWLLFTYNRRLWLYHTSGGTTATLLGAQSTVMLPIPASGRLAVRATLDVNNGASGHTVVYYTAPTMAGPWTQLGAPIVTAGTTSIFSGTASLYVMNVLNGLSAPTGAFYSAEVRSGIGGTVVANPNFAAQTIGATGFTDAAGRMWALEGASEITDRWVRCVTEVSEWPPRWHVSGHNITAPIEASGLLRRLTAGRNSLQSTLRRRIPSYGPLAYWPLEEGRSATQAYSPIRNVAPLRLSGFDFGSDGTLSGSDALPVLTEDARFFGGVRPGADGQWQVELVYKLDEMPASLTTMFLIRTTGIAPRILVQIQTNNVRLVGQNAAGDELFSSSTTAPGFTGAWNRLKISTQTSGGNVTARVGWVTIGEGGVSTPTVYAGTAGHVTSVESQFGPLLQGMSFGHLSVFETYNPGAYDFADHGFDGEVAGTRAIRLTDEQGVELTYFGDRADTTRMGPQRSDTLPALLEDVAESDGGILFEDRYQLALAYRGRHTLYNQAPALVLDYADLTQPFEPVEDDTVRNDVTVTRENGSSARVVLESGPLSVQPPPFGVGTYDDAVTLSLYEDTQPEQIAAWLMSLGTWDEARYPRIHVMLHRNPELIPAVTRLVEGDVVRIENTPPHLPAGPYDLMVDGMEDDFGPLTWDLYLTCSPAGPWTVGVLEDSVLGRADTDGSELAAAVTESDTVWPVHVTDGPTWITTAGQPSEFPFDVTAGGEVVTVTAITSPVKDAFGRTAASSWGTADVGGAWSIGFGSASDFSVASNYGIMTLTSTNASRIMRITSPLADTDVYVDVATSALATGGSLYGMSVCRYASSNDYYMARIEFTTAQAVILSVRKRVAGVDTQLGTFTTALTHVAGTFYRLRFQMEDTELRAKVWATTSTEPTTWQAMGTDSVHTDALSVGCRAVSDTANTNVSAQVRFDNFNVVNPQLFTVTRSVNGITKAQTAGTSLSLTHPMRAAL
ncbi:hypothetical protein ACFW9O_17835 [Streptomyces sp. NPDC059499]|uniref:hypothetical protein n=1 Tax=Streptomyces sp. NPDC059499 TaxID=3346852 RepID=UPI00369545A6